MHNVLRKFVRHLPVTADVTTSHEIISMGKCFTSLLALVALLFPLDSSANEQIQRVQQELRRRLLFFDDLNGEYTPALTTAIKRYQEKKGFASTGIIDLEVLASLGISGAAPLTVQVIGSQQNHGMYGPYGDALPVSATADARRLDSPAVAQLNVESAMPDEEDWAQEPEPPGEAISATPGEGDDPPFPVNFELTNERIHRSARADMPTAVVLAAPPGAEWKIGAMEESRAEKAGKPKRRVRKAPRVRQRKETNPIVLAFRSVDRVMRNVFAGTSQPKKRATPKRS